MRTKFIENYDISKLIPADYNPRFIDDAKIETLKKSISELGIIKPVIVNGKKMVLTAGHQRTRAMKAVGVNHCPVIVIKDVTMQDEIRFNLFHNSIETNKSIVKINFGAECSAGYHIISSNDISYSENNNPGIVKEICGMLAKYGEFGSVICDVHGNVIDNSDYAVAIKLLNLDLLVYVIDDDDILKMKKYFAEDYGEYYYRNIGVKTCNQFYAQPNRLSNDKKSSCLNMSYLYHNFVIDKIPKSKRILDFGAGKCAYVNLLRNAGYNIFAYEPNFTTNKKIDVKVVVRMINDIYEDMAKNGLYDYIVLDSVLNSVINSEIENIVLVAVNSFLKSDGTIILQTRSLDDVNKFKSQSTNSRLREIEFLDSHNFSVSFRNGVWSAQHFHSKTTLHELLSKYFSEIKQFHHGHYECAICKRPIAIDGDTVKNALNYELNIEYPNGYRHNKHEKLVQLVMKLVNERNVNYTQST